MSIFNTKSDELKYKIEQNLSNIIGTHPIYSHMAQEQMKSIINEVVKANNNISEIFKKSQNVDIKGGFIAEEFHAETFNLDAILKNKELRAYTDSVDSFKQAGYKKNDNMDIIIQNGDKTVKTAQVKYYKTAKGTHDALRKVNKNGEIKYEKVDSFVAPSEQVEGIKDIASKNILKEQAKDTRHQVEKAVTGVKEKTAGQLEHDGVHSHELSKKEANGIARDGKNNKNKVKIENQYKTQSTVNQMQSAAISAASMSAIIAGSINTISCLKKVHNKEISLDEAVAEISIETVKSAADSALKAAAVTGTKSLIIRYGSTATVENIAFNGLKSLAKSNSISVAVVSSIDLIKNIVSYAAGNMTKEELVDVTSKGVLTTSAGMFGSSLAIFAVGGFVTGSTLTAAAIPLIAGITGGIICSLALEIAVINRVDISYREILTNIQLQKETIELLSQLSDNMIKGQKAFYDFLQIDSKMDSFLQNNESNKRLITDNMIKAIDRI
ncbi:hypothetical protein HK18_10940 [Commensalibacter intestini]|uniref:Uncharacterized protein n=1 Tax=Commensalibacter intestini TaxID=479936 RepID=A0A251ZTR1_9PROT|nr:hypothetical protein [Commensalibacter intestini]OUI78053.1 hypothetical protein HK18_10940 [Commensalibacter intestini]